MIEFLANLLSESPLLFIIFIINAVLISYVAIYIAFYVLKKKQPGRLLYNFFWKMKKIKTGGKVGSLDDAYALIMESLKKEGVIDKDGSTGLLGRNAALKGTTGKKREVLQRLFDVYEARKYAGRGVKNEAETASGILADYLNTD
jgi:hypothetical protein